MEKDTMNVHNFSDLTKNATQWPQPALAPRIIIIDIYALTLGHTIN